MKKRWIGYAVALVMVSALAIPALAEDGVRKDSATLRPDYSIVLDGQKMNFKRADGSAAFALVYEDATYLPLRAIGETLGRNVNWDEATKTITLAGERTTASTTGTAAAGNTQKVTVQVRPDFHIVIDGAQRQFTTSAGKQIYPLLYDGSTYLPLRAIGQIMQKDIAWNQETKTITLTTSTVTDADTFTDAPLVTDADSFNQTTQTTQTPQTTPAAGDIGAEKAQQIALNHAGLTASQVQGLFAKADWDDGRKEYDVQFWQGSTEYDYEVDAATGSILKAEKDLENSYYGGNSAAGNAQTAASDIGAEKAQQVALNHAGLTASQAQGLFTKADWDDGRKEYDVNFWQGSTEYEYEIYASTGEIKKAEKDVHTSGSSNAATTGGTQSTSGDIGLEQAKQIALNHAGLTASQVYALKTDTDWDDGRKEYEVEFKQGRMEYDYEINAATGTILKADKEYDD